MTALPKEGEEELLLKAYTEAEESTVSHISSCSRNELNTKRERDGKPDLLRHNLMTQEPHESKTVWEKYVHGHFWSDLMIKFIKKAKMEGGDFSCLN